MNQPLIIEKTGRNTKPVDLISRLYQDRIIYLSGVIDSEMCDSIIIQLLWLNTDNAHEDINLYIHSPGGSIVDGFAIKDIINNLSAKVNTIGIGECSSMGAYLLACGTGVRKATESCRIMIHSLSTGMKGTFHDIKIDFKESEFLQEKILSDLSEFTGLSLEKIQEISNRDFYMSADEAIKLGFIDKKL